MLPRDVGSWIGSQTMPLVEVRDKQGRTWRVATACAGPLVEQVKHEAGTVVVACMH